MEIILEKEDIKEVEEFGKVLKALSLEELRDVRIFFQGVKFGKMGMEDKKGA